VLLTVLILEDGTMQRVVKMEWNGKLLILTP